MDSSSDPIPDNIQRIYVLNNINDPVGPNLSDVIGKGVVANGVNATQNTSHLTNSNDSAKSPLAIIKSPYFVAGFLGLLLRIASKKR